MVQNQTQLQVLPAKSQKVSHRSLKARNLDFYYRNLHIDCYYFYQQYEEHFEIPEAKSHKCISFATTFFCGRIDFCWQ